MLAWMTPPCQSQFSTAVDRYSRKGGGMALGETGWSGPVGSRAWIRGFSSTHRTAAWSGGFEVQAGHIDHLVDEQRAGGELEGVLAMGLEVERLPDAHHGRLGDLGAGGHIPR
ncbi:hypothetical protein LP52_07045 [Streptomonospora alba]|uniref:Uncharacterized protein n=1 Tax=Streptomonospora alba TaxID=183763 RepID=A0A0C2G8D6_9ACTN|nr:hypothetical protein LP52_07045 [Streptomonospora alba]